MNEINIAIDQLINIQTLYANNKNEITEYIKEKIEHTNNPLYVISYSSIWDDNKTLDDNLNTLIDCNYFYISDALKHNEDLSVIGDYLFGLFFTIIKKRAS